MSATLDALNTCLRPNESLETLQRRLIAEMLHKNIEEITDEFLHKFLEEHVYPTARLKVSSEYGGYDNSHLAVPTLQELDSQRTAVKEARERLRAEVAELDRK